MTHAPTLTTDRLTLTGHRPGDLEECAAMWADPAVYTLIGGQPRAREEVWLRLLRSIGQWAAFGHGQWIVRETDGGRFVGDLGLMDMRRAIDPPIDDCPETGWALAAHAHGRGYASEAMRAVLDWADGQGLARTVCIIHPDNAASIRLADRLGYRLKTTGTYRGQPTPIFERRAAG